MKRFPLAMLAIAACVAFAPALAADDDDDDDKPKGPPQPTPLNAQLFYELIVGEISAQSGEANLGIALILEAAKRTNDPQLYQRAVEVAFQSRSGEAALIAAREWRRAFPQSREANRYVLQILVALNRVAESIEPLRIDIALAPAPERNAVLASIPRLYARAADKKAAAAAVEQGLADILQLKENAAAGWTAIGRMRLAGNNTAGAIDAVRRAQATSPEAEGPALLALELLDPKQPEAEELFKRYLAERPLPELRMGYARILVDQQRYGEASKQIELVTSQRPDYPEGWLVQGMLQLQDNQDAAAEASYKRYLDLAKAKPAPGEERRGAEAQAYMGLSRIAEKRKDYAMASAWLDRIENPQDLIAAQQRRASLLARQGKLEEGRKLLRQLPEREPGDARQKMLAEVQLLRDNKQYKAAFTVLAEATAKQPFDADLVYDQAMIAEKMGDLPAMERLLRKVIAAKPDYHHAYNALGYSFAERNVRLTEAKELIQKALSFAPNDPFITDSLGWVEYRMGNKAEAVRILETAYKQRPDADIAAHLGEVLWSMGQRDRAQVVWKEGLLMNSDNDTLQDTLKRLRIKP